MLRMANKSERKYDYCGSCTFYLGAIIMTLLCQATAGVVSAALAHTYPDISSNGDFNTAFMICVQVVNIAFIILYSKLNGYKLNFTLFKHEKTGKGITPAVIIAPIIAAILLMVSMYLPTIWYGFFTRYALRIPPDMGSIDLSTTSSVVMIVIASVFLAPVCEETIYRGVLFNGLSSEKPTVKAVLLSALAFMLMHMSPVQVVFQFSLGVLSAFIMYKSKRLLPSVIMHAVANALALIMEMTAFADVLNGSVLWLTQNVVAALFITIGLAAGGIAALYALVRFGFDMPVVLNRIKNGKTYGVSVDYKQSFDIFTGGDTVDKTENTTPETVKDEILSVARKKDGTFRYWVGIVICAVLLIINLSVSVL